MPSINPDLLTDFEKSLPHHEMILVEGGVFEMGGRDEEARDNEKPVHKVRVSSFYMGKYPVTQALYEKVLGINPSFFKGFDLPVESVNWNDTQVFIKRLNLVTAKNYRLSTEAEWEFAARGGNYSEDYIFSGSDKLAEVGWYDENSEQKTHAIGQKMGNELGIYDMSGNVREWCGDWYSDSYYQDILEDQGESVNPIGPSRGGNKVLRGGSFFFSALRCRIGFRAKDLPIHRNDFVGFRLLLPKPTG